MKRITSALLFFPLLVTLLPSCSTLSLVEQRIEKNPAAYETLSSREKELVKRGEVAEGMSPEAVRLAWGRPGSVRSGSRNGRGTETWTYFESTPVHGTTFGMGYGYYPFYAGPGLSPLYGSAWSYGNQIDFARQVSRTVEFSNNRVVAWERRR